MKLFHHDDDSQLQGIPAIPTPKDDTGPTHTSVIVLEPNEKPRWKLIHRRKYKSGNYVQVWREVIDPAQNESERQGY